MGILDGIVEWIATQVMYGLDLISSSVLGSLGCNMDTFLRYFPAAGTMYMRFIRYTSTEWKDIYFVTYAGSIESNLMQMVMAKEKLNLFMKGQDADLDEIYDKFGVDYNLLSLLMRREADSEGKLRIRWGEQNIA